MSKIQLRHLAHAIQIVDRMKVPEQIRRMDAVFEAQPNLLLSLVALSKLGTPPPKLEVLFKVLPVIFEAMQASGKVWTVIDEDTQERCLKRVVARIKFTEDLPEAARIDAIKQASEQVGEPHLFVFVIMRLMEHGLFKVQTDADQHFILAALNLVECLSFER